MTSSPGLSARRDLSSVSSSSESKGVLDTSEKERNMPTRASAGIAGSPESFMWDFGWSRKSVRSWSSMLAMDCLLRP